jgi:hypothetical protein
MSSAENEQRRVRLLQYLERMIFFWSKLTNRENNFFSEDKGELRERTERQRDLKIVAISEVWDSLLV